MNIKGKWILFLFISLFFGGYIYISPFINFYGLKAVLEDKEIDTEILSDYIDFQSLRENIKAQVRKETYKNQSREEGDLFSGLGNLLGLAMVDKAVDMFVTPTNIQAIFLGRKIEDIENEKEQGQVSSQKPEISMSYKSFDRFRATVMYNQKKIVFIMKRVGLGWKLSNIIMHPKDIGDVFHKDKRRKRNGIQ